MVEIGLAELVDDLLRKRGEDGELQRLVGRFVMRELVGGAALGGFVFGKNFAGATDNLVGQSGEFSDFDTVTFVGRPAFDFAKEDDAAAGLFHGDVKVLHSRETISEFG